MIFSLEIEKLIHFNRVHIVQRYVYDCCEESTHLISLAHVTNLS